MFAYAIVHLRGHALRLGVVIYRLAVGLSAVLPPRNTRTMPASPLQRGGSLQRPGKVPIADVWSPVRRYDFLLGS